MQPVTNTYTREKCKRSTSSSSLHERPFKLLTFRGAIHGWDLLDNITLLGLYEGLFKFITAPFALIMEPIAQSYQIVAEATAGARTNIRLRTRLEPIIHLYSTDPTAVQNQLLSGIERQYQKKMTSPWFRWSSLPGRWSSPLARSATFTDKTLGYFHVTDHHSAEVVYSAQENSTPMVRSQLLKITSQAWFNWVKVQTLTKTTEEMSEIL